MTLRSVVTAVSGLLASVGVVAQDAQPPVFRGGSDAVRVDVSVKQGSRPVTNLTAADFEVRDQGVLQRVVDVSYEKMPIDVTIALDISGSVTGPVLDALKNAVNGVRGRLREGDRLKLTAFNVRIQRLLDFTEDRVDTNAAFGQIRPSGSTALNDTLAVLLTSHAPLDRRQLILTFTDGQDSSSISDAQTLLDVAQRTTATLSFVMPSNAAAPMSARIGISGIPTPNVVVRPGLSIPGLYYQLALETGGTFVPVEWEVAGAFASVFDEFRSTYVLHFIPTGVSRSGFHELQVGVTRRGTFDVKARRGYSAR